jgi:DNA mismatch endonuclease (patch repair protein)
MTDTLSKRERSRRMAAVRSTGNRATELKLISIFRANGITGWRRNARLPGKPDFVFRRERFAVFVDGCFWHGCRWHCRMPQSHSSYWQRKIAKNVVRDRSITRTLRASGWRVIRVWEHSLEAPQVVVENIKTAL